MKLKNSLWLLILIAAWAFAANDPMQMLQSTSDQMLSALKENKATLKTHPQVVYNLVNKVLLPHVDMEGMARSVLGRDAWLKATEKQKSAFKAGLTKQLIRTYSSALAAYTNETIRFSPIRGGVTGNRVQVESTIVRQNGPSIPVNYRLININDNWLIYDFSVEGVSILESFRTQFASDLATEGLDSLIKKMNQRNASAGSE